MSIRARAASDGLIPRRRRSTASFLLRSAPGGFAAPTHGMTRDPKGMIWFNVNTGKGGLGRIDPKTQKIDVFLPPDGMMPTGGATTVDYDGKGMIWSSAPEGALRFDPTVEKFTEFRSKTFKTPNGNGAEDQRVGKECRSRWSPDH